MSNGMNGEGNELRQILGDSITRLLTDHVTTETRRQAEDGDWPAELWSALEENGHPRVLVPEDLGGVGGGWLDAYQVIRAAGRFGAPVPLAETVLAGRLLAEAGLEVPEGPIAIAPVRADETLSLARDGGDWRLNGSVSRVPWGASAGHLAVLAEADGGPHIALVAGGQAECRPDRNMAREPRDSLTFRDAAVLGAALAAERDRVWLLGAMVRAAQMAGALDTLLDLSVQYANDRVQFGRPIGKFQAIQQQLAVLAGQTAATGVAAEAAFGKADLGAKSGDCRFEVAVAKVRAGEAADLGTSIAHQSHGAIGFTYEHTLHFSTRRLWSWRAEFGTKAHWAEELGRFAAGRGADQLWPYVTTR